MSSVPQHAEDREDRISDVRSLGVDIDDEQLVARILDGDRWAEEALYRKYARSLLATAIRLLGNRDDARDVIQDTFIVALRDLHQLRDPRRVHGWLRQVTVRQVHRLFRRRRVRRWIGLEDGGGDERIAFVPSQDASPEECAELGRIQTILDGLSAAYRVCWVLRFVEGYSVMEVAESCDCSHSTAKRRIAAANERVQRSLSDTGASSSD